MQTIITWRFSLVTFQIAFGISVFSYSSDRQLDNFASLLVIEWDFSHNYTVASIGRMIFSFIGLTWGCSVNSGTPGLR